MKVKFLRDYRVQSAEGESYAAGDVIECDDRSGAHFISRGAAEPAPEPKKAETKADSKPKAKSKAKKDDD